MILITLLIVLVLERYIHLGNFAYRTHWPEMYFGVLRQGLSRTGLWRGIPGLLLILLPVLVVVAVIYYGLDGFLYGLPGFIFAVAVLVYSLGPRDLYTDLEAYFIAEAQGNPDALQFRRGVLLACNPPEETNDARAVTKSVFQQYNMRIFAVLFWFVVLGPLGAALYRITAELCVLAERENSQEAAMQPAAKWLRDVLDWIPVRLAGLGYALMGDFVHAFAYWIKHVLSGLSKNQEFAAQSGLVALRLREKDADAADIHETKHALALIERTTVLYLVIIALLILTI